MIDAGAAVPIVLYVAYGWANSSTKRELLDHTVLLVEALLEEIREQPRLPHIVVGDFNCDVTAKTGLADIIRNGGLHDACALQHLTREVLPLATCLAHGSKAPTRRDFLLLSPEVLPWASSVTADFSA
eukprot:3854666-Alexandrium_andersonii.AAC.1